MNTLLLFSGGLDSFIGWHYLSRPDCLYIDLKHKYAGVEKERIKLLQTKLNIKVKYDRRLVLRDKEESDGNIPMRNSFLCHIAALHGGEWIYLIVQKGETHSPDRSINFLTKTQKLLSDMLEKEITIETPFLNMSKVDMVKWYREQGLSTENLLLTTSCYNIGGNNGNQCGYCSACFRRWVAFELNDLQEEYYINPWDTELARRYLAAARSGEYKEQRAEEIISALERKGIE